MRNYPYSRILFLFAFIAIVSCSKKEDPLLGPTEIVAITLTSDAGTNAVEVLSINESVNFMVMGSDGENYTSSAKILVNDIEIQGSAYTFLETGSYTVKAQFGSETSNILNFEVITETDRVLTIDFPRAMNNQTITFGLLDIDGNNTAADATFYVNGAAISGFTYSSATEGIFEIYAEYLISGDLFTSAKKSFAVYIPKRNVVLEDYTGTWCGYCLKAIAAIDSVKVLTNNHISVISIHKKSLGPEPMHFPQVVDLQAEFNIPNEFPQMQMNRTIKWNSLPNSIFYDYSVVTNIAGLETDLSVAINSQLNGATLSVDAKVIYRNGSEPGDKLVVYLLENKIIADQANYFDGIILSPYYGMGDPIKDYVHYDAMRNSLSNLFGDNIPDTPAYEEYKKTYTFNIPAEYNAANLSFVVMVVKADNSAKNSQHAEIGEDKTYY